jgi:GMP synthase (glutamine-hydrolysing)
MSGFRFLVVDGNPIERRAAHERDYGKSPGNAYGDTLLASAPHGSIYDICYPADPGANLPLGASIAEYDGVALTGSSLNLWNREPAVERQVELAREIFKSRTAFFGSCWGVQIACVAAGGEVQRNPAGREIGFARNIVLTDAGRVHPLLAGRPSAYDAPAIHLDIITLPSTDCTVLASNGLTPVQAAEIQHDGGIFWGIQYHPEFTLTEMATILRRLADGMVTEGFVRTREDAISYADDLTTLDDNRDRIDLAWRLGLDSEVLNDDRRVSEIRNWINLQVQPKAKGRGRG